MDQQYTDKIQAAVEEERKEPTTEKDTIILDSGVQLKIKKVPLLRIQAVLEQFKYPPVPEIYDPEKDRTYKNPFDPTYQEMRREVDEQRTWAVIDAVLAFGTRLEYSPEDVPSLESDDWIEELALAGIEVKTTSKLARYLMWVKFVAIVSADDLQKISRQFGLNMGISEEKIAEAMQSNFPGNTAR